MTALAAIHVAKKQLGLDEETYRAVLVRVTGKASAKDMDERERQRVVEELRKRGFKKVSKAPRKRAAGPYAGKLQALWIAMWNLGLVADPSDDAMSAFVKRQAGLDHTRFLIHSEDAGKVIEALKDWSGREAEVNWTVSRFQPEWTQTPGYRIVSAQFRMLKKLDPAFADYADPSHWIIRNVNADFTPWEATDADWIAVMNALGQHVRRARKVASS